MKKRTSPVTRLKKFALMCVLLPLLMQCADEEVLQASKENPPAEPESQKSEEQIPEFTDCSECTYVVPAGVKIIDGKKLNFQPGTIIGLDSKINYGTLEFHHLAGTTDKPIVIKNCGGVANIVATDKWHAIKSEFSKHFRITGGSVSGVYGIRVQGGQMGLKLDALSTNFEVDHVEVFDQTFAGIMAKTDPTCDDATIRGNFTMYDVSLHDNYVHDTAGEGFYVGNSFWDGMDRSCGKRLPHEIRGLKIYNNVLNNTGWEAIQVGCAIEGAEIYNNTMENYGRANRQYQNNGMQIGAGTGGLVYNNFIKNGPGNGLIIMGTGDNIIYNNIIVGAGSHGIFCDERYTPGEGFKFINNTILNPKRDGIRLYAEKVPMNTIVNNIIANPGSYSSYTGNRNTDDAFVYLLNPEVNVNMSNNLFVTSVSELGFVNPDEDNYRLRTGSPAINFGKDIATFKIEEDFYHSQRLKGQAYDIGASEY